MKFCPNCGSSFADDVRVCGMCGHTFDPAFDPGGQRNQYAGFQGAQPPHYGNAYSRPPHYQPYYRAHLNSNMLIWSVLCASTLMAGNFITGVLGIIAAVYVFMAKDERTPEGEAEKLKTAKILNIIATVFFAILVILVIIAFIALVVIGVESGYSHMIYM